MTEPAGDQVQTPALPPLLLPYDIALAAAYSAALARLRASMTRFIRAQFRRTGSWRDRDANAFASVVPPVVAGAQQTVSVLTSAYLHQLISEMTGTRIAPSRVPASEISGAAVRNGAAPEEVYRRPYTQVWTDLAAGTPLEQAVRKAERRAETIVNTDLQLARTHTARGVFQRDDRVVGYRRVPRGAYTCALCLIVSTRRYRKQDLMPVHPACDCDVEPVVGRFDPGPVLDEDFLNAIHDAIERDLGEDYVSASGRAKDTVARELDYRDIVVVHEHGEIGPVLGVRGHKFTGPADIRRLTHQRTEE